MFIILGLIIAPFAQHSFKLEAIRKLYVAKTKDLNLFSNPESDKHREKKTRRKKNIEDLSLE